MSSNYRPRSYDVGLVALGTALVLVTYVTPMATIVATAADLGAGPDARAWILSSMSVGLAAALLATGAIGDTVGRRRIYLVGLALMGAGSLVCAVADTDVTFVVARVAQGIGGAAVLSCGLAILADTHPPGPARAHATGIWGASVGVGITVGAVLAAALGSDGDWRGAYVVVAVASAALLLPSARWLTESSVEHARKLDLPGVVLLAGSMTLLVSGLTLARSGLTPAPVTVLVIALAMFALFCAVEVRTTAPMVDPALLRSPAFVSATVAAVVVGGGIISMTSNTPALVQQGLGGTLWAATGPILVWSGVSVATSLWLRRATITWSGSAVMFAALIVVGVGQLLGAGMSTSSSPWRLVPAYVVAGIATGVLNAVMGRESVASVPPAQAAMGSGANSTARYLGAACGITLFTVITHSVGSGSAAEQATSGWNVAVLVAAAITFAGALVVGLQARRRQPTPQPA